VDTHHDQIRSALGTLDHIPRLAFNKAVRDGMAAMPGCGAQTVIAKLREQGIQPDVDAFLSQSLDQLIGIVVQCRAPTTAGFSSANSRIYARVLQARDARADEWCALQSVRAAAGAVHVSLVKLIHTDMHDALFGVFKERMVQRVYHEIGVPIPVQTRYSGKHEELVYYIAGWVLKIVHSRSTGKGGSFDATWFWQRWAAFNMLSHGDPLLGELPVQQVLERMLKGGLHFASKVLYELLYRVEHIYTAMLVDEAVSLALNGVLQYVLRRVVTDSNVRNRFLDTMPVDLRFRVSDAAGSLVEDLLRELVDLYARMRGRDFTKGMLRELNSSKRRAEGNTRDHVASQAKRPRTACGSGPTASVTAPSVTQQPRADQPMQDEDFEKWLDIIDVEMLAAQGSVILP